MMILMSEPLLAKRELAEQTELFEYQAERRRYFHVFQRFLAKNWAVYGSSQPYDWYAKFKNDQIVFVRGVPYHPDHVRVFVPIATFFLLIWQVMFPKPVDVVFPCIFTLLIYVCYFVKNVHVLRMAYALSLGTLLGIVFFYLDAGMHVLKFGQFGATFRTAFTNVVLRAVSMLVVSVGTVSMSLEAATKRDVEVEMEQGIKEELECLI